ncbi:MAG: lysophospholipid acyltransferase family protein [Candidatus Omnitrophica bacterium]|jgi:1-acyl-sn-glycerol-3-phosphate acyltransferase|nr:lysophospholipid acyltransferase family protein [Candidatus Omnitrophota bacterium]
MFYWFVQIIIGILARFLFRFKIQGGENIPSKGGFILASNHRSNLDPVILSVCIDRKLFFLAKAELFENNVSKRILRRLNCIELTRSGEDKAALKKGIRLLHDGKGLLLFPEGTRSRDNRLGRARPGISLFAFTTGVAVIPVYVTGTEKALPIGSRMIKPDAAIRVVFGRPLYARKDMPHGARKAGYQAFADSIIDGISNIEKSNPADN